MPRAMVEGLDADRPLFEALRDGDDSVLPAVMQRHGRWVRGVIFAVLGQARDLDDVEQQVWLAVWRQSHTLQDPARWKYWLYRLAHNAAIDAGRRVTRQRGLWARLTQWHSRRETADDPAAQGLQVAEEHQRVLRAIAGLPALYREPFVLRHLEGWTYQQVADTLGLPVDTVETRLVRARRLLRQALGTGNDE